MADIITIDGPSSSGKSTIGLLFANRIGYQFIDTGAIYRAGSLVALRQKVDISDEDKLGKIFKDLKIEFKTVDNKVRIFLDDEDATSILHTPEVTKIVPIVAASPLVRELAKKSQYDVAQTQNTVMAGRDIGSEIFPDAPLKFFITASAEVRAKRRFEQHKKKGEDVTYEKILKETKERDGMDTNRKASPMRIPKDAVIVDTTNMDIERAAAEMIKWYTCLPCINYQNLKTG